MKNTNDIVNCIKNQTAKSKPLTKSEKRSLVEIIQSTDSSEAEKANARKKLIESDLRLVSRECKKIKGVSVDMFPDLFQEGIKILTNAYSSYNLESGYSLFTYEENCLRRTLPYRCNDMCKAIRVPDSFKSKISKVCGFRNAYFDEYSCEPSVDEISEAVELGRQEVLLVMSSLCDVVSLNTKKNDDDDSDTLEDCFPDDRPSVVSIVENDHFDRTIREAVDLCLTDVERFVIDQRYFYDDKKPSYEVIGKALYALTGHEYSAQGVLKIERRALHKLSKSPEIKKLRYGDEGIAC